jgi:hypothetical protein
MEKRTPPAGYPADFEEKFNGFIERELKVRITL